MGIPKRKVHRLSQEEKRKRNDRTSLVKLAVTKRNLKKSNRVQGQVMKKEKGGSETLEFTELSDFGGDSLFIF